MPLVACCSTGCRSSNIAGASSLLLTQRGKGCLVADAARVAGGRNAHVAVLTPVRRPGVAQDPIGRLGDRVVDTVAVHVRTRTQTGSTGAPK